ncbi:hypothetical protein HPB48_011559 [Haemaphysalis longicornis]|uniref:Uncharacterized protein n=1 Tax=Haemaphysalis longicornis TaxID=44386 RepID=A0A9J6FZS0_HAELO|nr:hypothetical protein HPB48_011559 [Haemaphysalis longicornis]
MSAKRRFLFLWCTFLAITFVIGLAALILAFRTSFGHIPTDITTVEPFCCFDVLDTLVSLSNRSVDPCADFLNYACYRQTNHSQMVSALRSLQSAVIHPTLQGRIRNPVTDRLRAHYRSCLTAFVENLCTPERTARAVLAMYRRWSNDPLSVNLLNVVGRLDFMFKIRSVFAATFQRYFTGSRGYVRHLLIEPLHAANVLDSNDSTDIEQLMFNAIREEVGGPVGVQDVRNFSARLRTAFLNVDYEDGDKHARAQNRTQLGQLLSRTNLSAWHEVLDYHEHFIASFEYVLRAPQAAQNILEVISDDNPQVQASGLAHFAILTASSVFSDDITFTYREGSIAQKAAYCDGKIVKLVSLWDMAATTEMTSPERDAVVRSMFKAIVAAVEAEIKTFFPDQAGLEDLLIFLKYVHLVLPQDLYDVYFQFIPTLGEDYIVNVMELRKFEFFFDASNVVRGLGNLWSFRGSVLEKLVSQYRNTIAVSPSIYALLSFTESGRNTTNGAVLGIWLADMVWGAFL